jgi:hypothetical protein
MRLGMAIGADGKCSVKDGKESKKRWNRYTRRSKKKYSID